MQSESGTTSLLSEFSAFRGIGKNNNTVLVKEVLDNKFIGYYRDISDDNNSLNDDNKSREIVTIIDSDDDDENIPQLYVFCINDSVDVYLEPFSYDSATSILCCSPNYLTPVAGTGLRCKVNLPKYSILPNFTEDIKFSMVNSPKNYIYLKGLKMGRKVDQNCILVFDAATNVSYLRTTKSIEKYDQLFCVEGRKYIESSIDHRDDGSMLIMCQQKQLTTANEKKVNWYYLNWREAKQRKYFTSSSNMSRFDNDSEDEGNQQKTSSPIIQKFIDDIIPFDINLSFSSHCDNKPVHRSRKMHMLFLNIHNIIDKSRSNLNESINEVIKLLKQNNPYGYFRIYLPYLKSYYQSVGGDGLCFYR